MKRKRAQAWKYEYRYGIIQTVKKNFPGNWDMSMCQSFISHLLQERKPKTGQLNISYQVQTFTLKEGAIS